MNIIANIKRFLNRFISENFKFKYLMTMYAIMGVHVFLVFLFCFFRIIPLIIFNIGSVAIYLYCINTIRYGYEKEMINTFYITYAEITTFAFFATICVGWNYGFPQYLIGLIPFGYYMCVTLIDSNKKYRIATILAVLSSLSYLICRLISYLFGSIYQLNVSPVIEISIYSFNTLCHFFLLFLFTLIFVLDMQTATKKLHNQNLMLDNMASTDPMTGLYNRRSMQAFLDSALKSESTFCLIMCDIDNFKRVNDTYGHDFGDIVIKDIAHIIQQEIANSGYVCRWGGEEILILCKEGLDSTVQKAENIRNNVEKHSFTNGKTTINCSLTLGVARHREVETVEQTITHADDRLYYGKQNGKNRVVSSYDMA